MAARPSWRGQIRLALVSIPVEIFPATEAGKSIADWHARGLRVN